MLQLKQLLTKKGFGAVTVPASASVGVAIRTMHEHGVGSVLVPGSDGLPAGILTERDIIRLYAEGRADFENLRVADCMTTNPTVASPTDKVTEILGVMTTKRFRHVPVVDGGQIVGLVSIGDLVKAKLDQATQEAEALRTYITS